ncbi:MAG: STAS/SEC14 domain-containing protein [Pseudomonadota bacterium]
MFDISKDPKGYVHLTISGPIGSEDMRAGLDAFLSCLEEGRQTDFLYTITDFEMPSLQAIGVEFTYLPQLLASIRKIGKVAVVSDQAWLRTAAEVEGKLIPGLTIESFEPSERAEAEAWLLGEV